MAITYTIHLDIQIKEEDLDTKGRDEDTQREEISSIAYEWADGLEKECYPPVRVKVNRSTREEVK